MCMSCGATIPFDGRSRGMFNYDNTHLFTVEFLFEFLQLCGRNGLAATSWWVTQVDMQVGLMDKPKKDADSIRKTWINFSGHVCRVVAEWVGLIDIPNGVFKCCDSPTAIAADGIVLSVRSNELSELKSPWLWFDAPGAAKTRASRPIDRSLPTTPEEVALLKDLSKGACEYSDLLSWLDNVEGAHRSSGPYLAILLAVAHRKEGDTVKCPDNVRDFVLSMTRSISPALQLLPSATWPIVSECLVSPNRPNLTADLLHVLAKYSPLLSRLLISTRDTPQEWRARSMDAVVQVIKDLHHMAVNVTSVPFDSRFNQIDCTHILLFYIVPSVFLPYRPSRLDLVAPFDLAWQELMETGVYAPNYPIKRRIPHATFSAAEETSPCNKHAKDNTHLGPGVTLLWCVEHRCCLGFSIMTSAESPRTLYELLAARFDKPPSVVIYDNACSVAAYAMNRIPGFF